MSRLGLAKPKVESGQTYKLSWVDSAWAKIETSYLDRMSSSLNSGLRVEWSLTFNRNLIALSKQENWSLRYFNYFIQTKYLTKEKNSTTSNSNSLYSNFLELLKSLIQTQGKCMFHVSFVLLDVRPTAFLFGVLTGRF